MHFKFEWKRRRYFTRYVLSTGYVTTVLLSLIFVCFVKIMKTRRVSCNFILISLSNSIEYLSIFDTINWHFIHFKCYRKHRIWYNPLSMLSPFYKAKSIFLCSIHIKTLLHKKLYMHARNEFRELLMFHIWGLK